MENLLSIAVQIPPNSKGSFRIPEDDIQETDGPVFLPLLLPLLGFLLPLLHYVLDIEPKVIFKTSCDDVVFDEPS
jgi:hypothetical protein